MAEAATAMPAYEVRAGYAFPAHRLAVTAEEQHQLHGYCDIPAALYGERLDPGFLARYPIRVIGQALFACHPERGYVHMGSRIRQHAPGRLDEPVDVTGRFTRIEPVPRGWIMHAAFEFRRPDGTLLLEVEPWALMADPTRMPPGGATAAKPKPEDGPRDAGFVELTRKQCTPEKVKGYCGPTKNLIHLDPDYARGFGFRAPITAGNQIVNYTLEAVASDRLPSTMDLTIRFLRPVFWDDAVIVEGRREGGRLHALRVVTGDGRLASTSEVAALGYA